MNKSNSVFNTGFLTQLYIDVVNKKPIDKLENAVLTRIATILGKLSKDNDLYDLLFEQAHQVLEIDRLSVDTKDLMAFVLLDHTYTRGYFAKAPGSRATSDTTNSQGVPLAFEGAKRLYNKKYSSWLTDINSRDDAFKVDVFLPAELGTYTLNEKDEIVPNKLYGLLALKKNNVIFTNEEIGEFRSQIPNWASAHRPKMLADPEVPQGGIFNKLSHKMRCMVLQGWIWQPVCRNEDMICDVADWDSYPSAINFEGLKPQVGTFVPGLRRFA